MALTPQLRAVLLALCLWLASCVAAFAQEAAPDWEPRRPMTLVVPSNPGGGWDQTARFMQRALQNAELVPTSIDVINRGGAGGTIALSELVARGAGDPHRLMVGGFGLTSSALMNGSQFSPLDATPIARLTGEYQVIAVPADSPFTTAGQLFDALRADPSSISWAGGSAGGSDQIFIVQAAMAQGIDPKDVNYVAFTGGGEAASALLGGQVSAGISGYSEFAPLAEGGRLRMLAISAPDRRVDADLPTLRELGVDLEFQNWRGLFAAPNLSEAQRGWLIGAVREAQATPFWRDVLARNGWQDSYLEGDAFAQFIAEDRERTRAVLQAMDIGRLSDSAVVGPWTFPVAVGLGLLLSTLLIAVSDRRTVLSPGTVQPAHGSGAASRAAPAPRWFAFARLLAILALYAVGIALVGFVWSTPLFILAVCAVFSARLRVWMVVFSVLATAAIWLVFEQALGVGLP